MTDAKENIALDMVNYGFGFCHIAFSNDDVGIERVDPDLLKQYSDANNTDEKDD